MASDSPTDGNHSQGDDGDQTTPPPSIEKPIDIYKEIAAPTAPTVDAQYTAKELVKVRTPRSDFTKIDMCEPALAGHNSFGDRIAFAVDQHFVARKAEVSYVASIFSLPSKVDSYVPTSLMSHQLCPVTREYLETTFENWRVPTDAVIAKADRFSKMINAARAKALQGDRAGKVEGRRLWTKFMMCLSYMESLSSADTSSSDTIAARYDFRRPAGVSLYDDPYQKDPASVLAIGVFQMSGDSGGDPQSCIRQWNKLYPSCSIDQNSSWRTMIDVFGSSLQTFNTFCGANKVTDMFGVQVNATKAKNTHPANVLPNGQLKAPADRCVSPFMNVNTSYNHFGPFQNVHDFTLDEILSCTLKNE